MLNKICKSINVNFEDKLKTLTCLPRPYDIYTLVNRFFDHGLIFFVGTQNFAYDKYNFNVENIFLLRKI